MRWLLLLLLLPSTVLAQAPSGPAPGGPNSLPGIGREDPRRPVNWREMPWRALGRVQVDVAGRCTGALIAPNMVLTAAHCLISPRTRGLASPQSIQFIMGVPTGSDLMPAPRVVSYRIGKGFGPPGVGYPGADWAVLMLDRDVVSREFVLPLLAGAPAPRTPLMLGGFQQDRPETLVADTQCRALGVTQAGLLLHDCAGTRGVSGGPLLTRLPGGSWAVAGVASRAAAEAALGAAVAAPEITLAFR